MQVISPMFNVRLQPTSQLSIMINIASDSQLVKVLATLMFE